MNKDGNQCKCHRGPNPLFFSELVRGAELIEPRPDVGADGPSWGWHPQSTWREDGGLMSPASGKEWVGAEVSGHGKEHEGPKRDKQLESADW